MNKLIISIMATLIGFSPLMAHAQSGKTLADMVDLAIWYLDQAFVLLIAFATVAFVYYVIRYFIQPNDKRAEAAQYVMWSILGFFIIVSMWGLVNLMVNTFQLRGESPRRWTDINRLFPN